MKHLTTLIVTLLSSLTIFGQDITGDWQGILNVQGIELRIVLHFNLEDNAYTATMDSPDQGATGIPVSNTLLNGKILTFEVPNAGVRYEGTLDEDELITGTFKQNGQTFPLNFKKQQGELKSTNRPQEPKPPYPYKSEDVKFTNEKDSIVLAGTFTFPKKGKHLPAVILISGSGPQNRDEEIFGHKPFLVIADYLTRNGIAVLRFDDRGTGMSEGDFNGATSLDFSMDVQYAVKYLQSRKEIDDSKIGLVGHSEGGMIAPMVASNSNNISFMVLLAGPGITGEEIILKQTELIGKAYGIEDAVLQASIAINKGAYQIVMQNTNPDSISALLFAYFKQSLNDSKTFERPNEMSEDVYINTQITKLTRPWMKFFLYYDPAPVLAKVSCPVLALNGEKDLQVPPNENIEAIKESLNNGGNKNVTTEILPGLNHLFQECDTGLPIEYGKIEQTFSPVALNKISQWIFEQIY